MKGIRRTPKKMVNLGDLGQGITTPGRNQSFSGETNSSSVSKNLFGSPNPNNTSYQSEDYTYSSTDSSYYEGENNNSFSYGSTQPTLDIKPRISVFQDDSKTQQHLKPMPTSQNLHNSFSGPSSSNSSNFQSSYKPNGYQGDTPISIKPNSGTGTYSGLSYESQQILKNYMGNSTLLPKPTGTTQSYSGQSSFGTTNSLGTTFGTNQSLGTMKYPMTSLGSTQSTFGTSGLSSGNYLLSNNTGGQQKLLIPKDPTSTLGSGSSIPQQVNGFLKVPTSQSTFGGSSQLGTSQTSFGGQQTFGSSSQPTFGGSSNQTTFGSSSQSSFGSSQLGTNQTSFGGSSQTFRGHSNFGSSNNSGNSGTNSFSNTQPSFGSNLSSNNTTFGNSFGSSFNTENKETSVPQSTEFLKVPSTSNFGNQTNFGSSQNVQSNRFLQVPTTQSSFGGSSHIGTSQFGSNQSMGSQSLGSNNFGQNSLGSSSFDSQKNVNNFGSSQLGQSSQQSFGSTQLGQSNFGTSQSTFGGSSQQTTFGSFGQSQVNQQSQNNQTFGGSSQQTFNGPTQQPLSGSSQMGNSQPTFGGLSQSNFGSNNSGNNVNTNSSNFGSSTQPSFGSSNFQDQKPTQNENSTFGNENKKEETQQPTFGDSTPSFGGFEQKTQEKKEEVRQPFSEIKPNFNEEPKTPTKPSQEQKRVEEPKPTFSSEQTRQENVNNNQFTQTQVPPQTPILKRLSKNPYGNNPCLNEEKKEKKEEYIQKRSNIPTILKIQPKSKGNAFNESKESTIKLLKTKKEMEMSKLRLMNTHLPKLKRDDYYTIPALESLEESDLKCVKNFTVCRKNVGRVQFSGVTNITGLNLDEIVFIERGRVIIYPDENSKPKRGMELNKPALVTMFNIHSSSLSPSDFIQKLKTKNGKFVHYDKESGEWIYSM